MTHCARCGKSKSQMKQCSSCQRFYCDECSKNEFTGSNGYVCNHCAHKKQTAGKCIGDKCYKR